jgi:hypothetical protein
MGSDEADDEELAVDYVMPIGSYSEKQVAEIEAVIDVWTPGEIITRSCLMELAARKAGYATDAQDLRGSRMRMLLAPGNLDARKRAIFEIHWAMYLLRKEDA